MAPDSGSRAGTLATPADLVDVAHLVTAYYTGVPDPDNIDQQVAFGTSGHRGSVLKTAFNETHILATTQAICDYRKEQGFDGPLFIGRDTHGLSEPAWATALEVLAANDVTVLVDADDGYTPTPAVSHAIIKANGGRHDRQRPGRRHRGHAVAQPAGRRRLQVQPAARRAGRHRRHVGHRRPGQRADPGRAGGRDAHPVRPGACGRVGVRLHGRRTSTTCRRSSTSRRSAKRACGSEPTRSAARRSTTGARSVSGTVSS